jgi:hypothetical protein
MELTDNFQPSSIPKRGKWSSQTIFSLVPFPRGENGVNRVFSLLPFPKGENGVNRQFSA